MAPDAQEIWTELKELRNDFTEFRLAVFRDHNALLKEIAQKELQDAKDNSVWSTARRWLPLFTIMAIVAGLLGSVVGVVGAWIAFSVRGLRP